MHYLSFPFHEFCFRIPSSSKRPSQRREYTDGQEKYAGDKSNSQQEGRANSPVNFKHESDDNYNSARSDQKKNIISISKCLEMEKNLGAKNEDPKKIKTKVVKNAVLTK